MIVPYIVTSLVADIVMPVPPAVIFLLSTALTLAVWAADMVILPELSKRPMLAVSDEYIYML